MKTLANLPHIMLQHLIWYIIKALISTYKIEIRGIEHREKARSLHPKGAYIFAVWHEQVVSVMSGHAWTQPYLALASRSKDGDYAAFVSTKMGFISVRGSSKKRNKDKGGKEAMLEYIHKMRQGFSGGITVDGPKGPRQVCKPGVVVIAKETGAAVLPVVGIAQRYWKFNSWDQFKIPKPFSRIIMEYGEPVSVAPESTPEDIEAACDRVRTILQELEAKIARTGFTS